MVFHCARISKANRAQANHLVRPGLEHIVGLRKHFSCTPFLKWPSKLILMCRLIVPAQAVYQTSWQCGSYKGMHCSAEVRSYRKTQASHAHAPIFVQCPGNDFVLQVDDARAKLGYTTQVAFGTCTKTCSGVSCQIISDSVQLCKCTSSAGCNLQPNSFTRVFLNSSLSLCS